MTETGGSLKQKQNLLYQQIYSKQSTLAKLFLFSPHQILGHKILKVITGDADLYLLSKNTTFKWDTCGPQAILNAIEGGLFKIEEIIESGQIIEVDYDDERPNLNEGGLLALRREEKHILQDLYNKK